MSSHLVFKILVVGDKDVGKTTLINHYTLMPACFNSGSTIGIDFQSRMVALSADPDSHADAHADTHAPVKTVKKYDHIKCCFWDTSGSPQYQSIAHTYYTHVAAIIAVFDLSNEKTYADLHSYIRRAIMKNVCNHLHKHPILVLGNKLDKRTIQKTRTQIQSELSCEFPNEIIKYAEVSCLDKLHVDNANYDAIMMIHNDGKYNPNNLSHHSHKTPQNSPRTVVYNCATCAKSSDVHSAITSFLQLAYDNAIKPHYYNPNATSEIACAGINGTSRYFNLKRDNETNDSSSYRSIKTPRKCCVEQYYLSPLIPSPSSPSSSPSSPSKKYSGHSRHSGCSNCTIL